MNKVQLILIVVLFGITSCNDSSNKKFKEYIILYNLNIEEVENNTKFIKGKIDEQMYENPIATKKWFQKSNLTTKYCDKMKAKIDSLIKSAFSNNLSQTSLSKQDSKKLRIEVINMQDSLVNLIEYKEEIALFQEYSKELFSILETDKIMALNGEEIDKNELTSVLLKLRLDVCVSELSAISLIFLNVGSSHRWFTLKPQIVTNSKIVKTGQDFKAEIYYANFDTITDYIYEIEGKKYKSKEGVAHYKHKVTEDSGLVIKKGKLIFKMPRTGKDSIVPFEIKYKVLPK